MYWIGEIDKDIRYYELLRIAVANRKLIIQALDKDLDDAELEAYLAKALKITPAESKIILDLKIRQLKKLEDKKLVDKIKELKTERSALDKRAKKPAEYVPQQLDALLKTVQ
jgi:DNA gyrase/topoisomerase IV subunit A